MAQLGEHGLIIANNPLTAQYRPADQDEIRVKPDRFVSLGY